jgi:hypothetical protein
MMSPSTLILLLVLSNAVTVKEADLLQKKLALQIVPQNWRDLKDQIEEIINRTIDIYFL